MSAESRLLRLRERGATLAAKLPAMVGMIPLDDRVRVMADVTHVLSMGGTTEIGHMIADVAEGCVDKHAQTLLPDTLRINAIMVAYFVKCIQAVVQAEEE